MKTILVIGAGGFIGGFIARQAARQGLEVWAGVRPSTSRRYLEGIPGLRFVEFDYDSPSAIASALDGARPEAGRWHYVIWNLGATKCANFQDFNRINYQYLRNFVEQLQPLGLVPDKFLFMSSLSALGPADEKGYTPITGATIPNPNTRYGLSKIKAETFLQTQPWLPWVIFRPTGVYGPHEQDYLMMIKSIDRHIDVGMGYRKQLLTFIYVEDLVNAMFLALEADVTTHRTYIISEPRAYTQRQFRSIVARELGGRWVLPLKLPMWAVYAVSAVCEKWAALHMRASTLNRDKFKIMKQRNWNCDVSDAVRDFGFAPEYSLEDGIRATVEAYCQSKKK